MTKPPDTATGDRRPIATRERKWSRALAHALSRRGVSPNGISITGMICAIIGGGCFAATGEVQSGAAVRLLFLGGALMAQGRLIANMLDGMVAIESARTSPVGELYNEIPDRVSDAAILIGLGYAAGGAEALGYVAACMAIFVAYIRAMGKVAGGADYRQDFSGPMAKPQRMFAVTVAAVYLAVAPAAWQPTFFGRPEWGLPAATLLIIAIGCLVTALRRLRRIAGCLRNSSDG